MSKLTRKHDYLPSETQKIQLPTVGTDFRSELNCDKRKSTQSNEKFYNSKNSENLVASTSIKSKIENQEYNDKEKVTTSDRKQNQISSYFLNENTCSLNLNKSGYCHKLFLESHEVPNNIPKTDLNTLTNNEIKCEKETSHVSNFPVAKYVLNKHQDSNPSTSNKPLHFETDESTSRSTGTKVKLFSKQSSLKQSDENQTNQVKIKLRSMWNNVKYGNNIFLKIDF